MIPNEFETLKNNNIFTWEFYNALKNNGLKQRERTSTEKEQETV